MFVDASVLVAIINREDGWKDFVERLQMSESPVIVSALGQYEAVAAIARASSQATGLPVDASLIHEAHQTVDDLCAQIGASEIEISSAIGRLAIDAAARYGKIVRHKAALNFGDCFAYACAKSLGVPLLYKGNDFAQTDLA